jgi:hypothetical protein
MNVNFKLPRNIISNNVVKNVLYLITLALAVSYIINEQSVALISLILIACGIYLMNKSVVIALFISIIITNLLLATNYFKNIYSVENLVSGDKCCSGETFYTDNISTYNTLSNNINNKATCEKIERDIIANMPTNESQKARFFSILYSNNDYAKATSICNTMDPTSTVSNMKGTLFKKSDSSSNVLDDPNILPKDILDIIATSNFKSSLTENNKNILETRVIAPLEIMNTYLFDNSRQKNLQRPINISDLTSSQKIELENIIKILKDLYTSSNSKLLTKTTTTYTLVSKNDYQPVLKDGVKYLLNPDQFFDCSGIIHSGNSGTLSASDIIDLSNNDYFGTSGIPIRRGGLGDASYNPYGTLTQAELYPSNKDLEMELRRLETIPASGNVPVNIISTYLNAINSFYEKQIQNLTNTRSSTFSQTPINDIYSIRTMKPTFFTYDHTTNNDYQCQDSITGNSAFKYCGPSAYYEIPKF